MASFKIQMNFSNLRKTFHFRNELAERLQAIGFIFIAFITSVNVIERVYFI